jgi:hypothetical protein
MRWLWRAGHCFVHFCFVNQMQAKNKKNQCINNFLLPETFHSSVPWQAIYHINVDFVRLTSSTLPIRYQIVSFCSPLHWAFSLFMTR